MLLLMCWTNPQEELTLNSKLSEKFPTSGPNFARYIYTLYTIDYTVLVLVVCTCNTFRNMFVWFVLCGAEFLDLNLSFAYPSARFFSAFANVFADFFFFFQGLPLPYISSSESTQTSHCQIVCSVILRLKGKCYIKKKKKLSPLILRLHKSSGD